jgi:hypothetical protein
MPDVQVVGYEAAVDGPAALRLAEGGSVRREELPPGRELSLRLGERRCAGAVDDGGHAPCDAGEAPRCPAHTRRWPCARCTGDCSRPLPSCREEHAVYLAAFAPDVWKVGVTRSWRVETRLREQGADRAARLRAVPDGRRARRIEAGIADTVPDRVRVPTKIAGLHRAVEAAAWESFLDAYDPETRFAFDYDLDLDRQPVPATTAAGTVRGTKGRVLVLDRAGTTYAVDMRDLVGHLVDDDTEETLQASLGAFD